MVASIGRTSIKKRRTFVVVASFVVRGLGHGPVTLQLHTFVPRSCLIASSSGIPAMHNGIQEMLAGTFALRVAGVFVDGRPAHMHSHPLRCR